MGVNRLLRVAVAIEVAMRTLALRGAIERREHAAGRLCLASVSSMLA
jgi:hypothetical protein